MVKTTFFQSFSAIKLFYEVKIPNCVPGSGIVDSLAASSHGATTKAMPIASSIIDK